MGITDNSKQNIGHLFNRIAGTYDRLNHLLSLNTDRRWRRRAVRRLSPCDNALDVASGTADLAIEMARQNRVQQVIGIDLSEEMLRLGNDKIRKAGLSARITLQQGSALALPRVVAALLEDNQKDGYIEIPEVLRPYTGFDRID